MLQRKIEIDWLIKALKLKAGSFNHLGSPPTQASSFLSLPFPRDYKAGWSGVENTRNKPCQFPFTSPYLDLPNSCLSIYHKLTKCSLLWEH